MSSAKNVFSGSVWGILSKILSAVAKFLTIPMLVAYYGRNDYGLIALAFSLNAYLRLMDIGLNIGSVRFFSIWLSQGETEKIKKVANSSVVFYGVVGLINAIVFLIMAYYAGSLFSLSAEQLSIFKWMMCLLAVSSVFNWVSNVITQLLTAYGDLAWLNKANVVSNFFDLFFAFLAVQFKQSLQVYFFFYILSTLIIIPINLYKLKQHKISLFDILMPRWYGSAFKEVMGYSMGIFVMGIFQFSADSLRPLLLGKYASGGVGVLTEFRVIQTISSFLMMFGGVFIQTLLPFMSKLGAEDKQQQIGKLLYDGTRYISAFISFFIFLFVINARSILVVYMGKDYAKLDIWLIIWLITLLGMHTSVVSSLILSTGKTKPIAIMAAISCILSLTVTAFLAPKYDVGAAVIGYFIYVVMQNAFYYFYYMPRILNINSRRLFFGSFLPATATGIAVTLVVLLVRGAWSGLPYIWGTIVDSFLFSIIFGIIVLAFIIRWKELDTLRRRFLT